MSAKTFAYVSLPVDLEDPNTPLLSMHITDVKGAIITKLEQDGCNGEVLFFIDDEGSSKNKSGASSRRSAFDMMLGQLSQGAVVIMWSWQCLVNRGRPEWASFDVQDALRKLHEHECSAYFVREEICTNTAVGRFVLNNLLTAAQYKRDFALEQSKEKESRSSSACCSGSSPSNSHSPGGMTFVEILSKSGTGC